AAAAFLGLLAVWTYLLLEPKPVPESVLEILSIIDGLKFFAAKSLHAGGYATLAGLGLIAASGSGRRTRAAVVGFLLLHGAGTEIGQTFVPNRSGKVTDVAIDWAGITAGVFAWRRFGPRPAVSDSQSLPGAGCDHSAANN
ncbi:MAG: VanZ family protein, partial [Fimbriiglobus sp.]